MSASLPETPLNIALIGCGKMGSALLKGWLKHLPQHSYQVIQPDPLPSDLEGRDFAYHESIPDDFICDIIVFATKPQIMDQVLEGYRDKLSQTTLVLSVAAGSALSYFEQQLSPDQPLIRAMPNTPAAIGAGITALCANGHVSDAHKQQADTLLSAVGETVWLKDEALMDVVTAVSGSGPAYVFYLIEALSTAGQKAGLPENLAVKLARQTVIGAGALADHNAEMKASQLREAVTSPGGTTEAALRVLMDGVWQDTLSKAVHAATQRSKELSS